MDVLCLDSSHAHPRWVLNAAERITSEFPETPLIVGNVATAEGVNELVSLGVGTIKVGIGPGSICTIRVVTGAGMPHITAVLECARAAADHGAPVIAMAGFANPATSHQGPRRGCGRDHDRIALFQGRRVAQGADPVLGPDLQGLSGDGLGRRHERS